jgi:hypothetical protein
MTKDTMALEQELATFEQLKAELLTSHFGRFAVIRGEDFIGAFVNPAEAYRQGFLRSSGRPFLVKRISHQEPDQLAAWKWDEATEA